MATSVARPIWLTRLDSAFKLDTGHEEYAIIGEDEVHRMIHLFKLYQDFEVGSKIDLSRVLCGEGHPVNAASIKQWLSYSRGNESTFTADVLRSTIWVRSVSHLAGALMYSARMIEFTPVLPGSIFRSPQSNAQAQTVPNL